MKISIKKYILSGCLIVSTAASGENNNLYAKIGTGLNQINPIAIQTNDLNGKIKLAHNFPLVEAGLGLRLTDSIRTELVFDHYFLFYSEENSSNAFDDSFKISYKTKISALMFNGYKNIITAGRFTPFIGGGIGISFLDDKATGSGKNIAEELFEILDPVSSQKVHRFAYKLTAGVDIALTDNATLDLSYNYLNLGRNKPRILESMNNMIARDYLVHNLTASIRFNL